MYIKIKIEVACNQNKLKFRRALIGRDVLWFIHGSYPKGQLVFDQQFALGYF